MAVHARAKREGRSKRSKDRKRVGCVLRCVKKVRGARAPNVKVGADERGLPYFGVGQKGKEQRGRSAELNQTAMRREKKGSKRLKNQKKLMLGSSSSPTTKAHWANQPEVIHHLGLTKKDPRGSRRVTIRGGGGGKTLGGMRNVKIKDKNNAIVEK